ncbi:MAG: hypothetical protein U0795_21710 [Pirellulales bacterium]
MCCFSQRVESVRNTRIFARLSGRGTQFLAYQMNYESRDANAMILPLPVRQPADDKSLKFIDLSHYDAFFDDLANGFPFRAVPSIGCSARPIRTNAEGLEVFAVGNYIASFVPTLTDFDRLDAKFKLPVEVWNKIPGYEDYSFAVFQLAAGSLRPHPMAFEFQARNDELFFPTVHIHDGKFHPSEEFDHALYMQHAGLDSKVSSYANADVGDSSTGLIRSKYRASQFCQVGKTVGLVAGDLLVHRKFILGEHPNADTVFAPSGDPVRPSLNLRPLLSYFPWLVGLAAIGWLLHRRSKLMGPREVKSIQSKNPNET